MRATRKWSGRKVHAEINDWRARRKSQSVTREARRPICRSCNGGEGEWYFGGEEQSREGTASRRLRLALSNARLAHLFHRGVAASNILSWRMIASLTLIYRPSKVGLPPSIPLHMKGRTTLRLLGRVEERGGVTRQLERDGRTEAESASETNKRWADRSGIGNERAGGRRQIPREREVEGAR